MPGPAAAAPVRRLVSAAPHATEIAFALGLSDRVVGRTDWCREPAAATALPSIGGYSTPSLERILALRPDAVCYVPSVVQDAAAFESRLRAAGIRTLPLPMAGIASVHACVQALADAAGEPAAGRALVARLEADVAAARAAFAGRPARRVLVVVFHDGENLNVAGPGTFVNELLAAAGGVNAIPGGQGYFVASPEAVVAGDPDVILDAGGPMEDPAAATRDAATAWGRFATLRAVREGRVHVVGDSALIVPGVRLAHAIRLVGGLVHGTPAPAGAGR